MIQKCVGQLGPQPGGREGGKEGGRELYNRDSEEPGEVWGCCHHVLKLCVCHFLIVSDSLYLLENQPDDFLDFALLDPMPSIYTRSRSVENHYCDSL